MALHESPREDLLAQATAYPRRLLLRLPVAQSAGGSSWQELFFGLRQGGGWTVYLDQQPVMHFTASGQIRRLYMHNHRFAADRGRLQRLQRHVAGGKVHFEPRLLPPNEEAEMLSHCRQLLTAALHAWRAESGAVIGQFPSDDVRLAGELQERLERLPCPLSVADAPNA